MSQNAVHREQEDGWVARRIITPRLALRAFRPEDAQDVYEYLSIPEIYRFEPGEPVDRRRAKELATEMSTAPDFWAVEFRADRMVMGQIYFKQMEPLHMMTWELGYIISPSYQRQGYASEAISALLTEGFASAGIHRVVANCNPDNKASWRLLERMGFRREGLHRKNVFFRKDPSGKPLWTDTLVYAILEDELPPDGGRPGKGLT